MRRGERAIDIIYLVDRLEALLTSGKRMPFSTKVLVDEQECLDIIDQMRIMVPEEIKQARRINQDRERIIAQAQAEAEKVASAAQSQVAALLDERGLLDEARIRSEEIIAQSQREAEEIRIGADAYARDVLLSLQRQLNHLDQTIAEGLRQLSGGAMEEQEEEA